MKYKWVIASDIDNTLTGNRDALEGLGKRLSRLRDEGSLFLILSTGRTIDQVVRGFDSEGIPLPDAVVSQVGTEIYLPPISVDSRPTAEWNQFLVGCFSREEALELTRGISGLKMQPDEFNTPLKLSFFVESDDAEGVVRTLRNRINRSGTGEGRVIWSSGKDLDIIPAAAGKGKAVSFLLEMQKIEYQTVIAAGDSGNDLTMFEEFHKGIIVGNAQPELRKYGQSGSEPGVYQAEKSFAAGVSEGLDHFGLPG